MERYDIDSEEQHGIITVKMYNIKHGDWVKYEDAASLENELAWALKHIEGLEDELEDERAMTKSLEKELKDYENPV
jgi:predicted  nucleic acid-binding Zn-ribbon protein